MLSGPVLGGGEWPPGCAEGPHGNERFENREAREKECGNFPLRVFREVSTLTDHVVPDGFCTALFTELSVSRVTSTG